MSAISDSFSFLWNFIGPGPVRVFISAIAATLILLFFAKVFGKLEKKQFLQVLFLVSCISVLGAVVGNAAGLSREGVVGDILPAAMGLAGGVGVSLFGGNPERGLIASVTVTAFFLSLSFSLTSSSYARSDTERQNRYLELCTKAFSDADLLSNETGFLRFVSIFGKQCAEGLATDYARLLTPQESDEFNQNVKEEFGKLSRVLNLQ